MSLYRRQLYNFFKNNQDLFVVTAFILIKIAFFSYRVGYGFGPAEMIVSSLAIISGITCFFVLLPYFVRTTLLTFVDLAVSTLLLADTLFFRVFHSVISIPVFLEAQQVGGVSSSIFMVLAKGDLLLFADFLVLIPYFIYLNRRHIKPPALWRRRFSQFSLTLMICALVLVLAAQNVKAGLSDSVVSDTIVKNSVLLKLGVVNYHLFDLYSFVKENRSEDSNDESIEDDIDISAENSIMSAEDSVASTADSVASTEDSSGNTVNTFNLAPPAKFEQIKGWMAAHRQTSSGDLAGIAKGKNLIIIQMEAMQQFLIGASVNGQEITPNLNRLTKSSIYFDNYFTQVGQGTTSDAEFMTLNSLYPDASGSNYFNHPRNTFESLPWILKQAGYQGSYVFHPYKPDFWNRTEMYRTEGFNKFFNSSNFFKNDETIGMGLSDQSMYRQVLDQMKKLQAPYFSFIITLSGHSPYEMPDNKKGLSIPKGQYSDSLTNYMQIQHYADQALGTFIDQLKQEGILDNSLVVIYGDHYGPGLKNEDLQKFLGRPTDTTMDLYKVPLLIHLPGDQEAGVRHISGGQMDVFPTLLNLLGIGNSNLFYFGQDLLNAKAGFSAFRVFKPEGSFATDNIIYIASNDGKFENGSAYDRKTGQKAGLEGLKDKYLYARWQLSASDYILKNNRLSRLVKIKHY